MRLMAVNVETPERLQLVALRARVDALAADNAAARATIDRLQHSASGARRRADILAARLALIARKAAAAAAHARDDRARLALGDIAVVADDDAPALRIVR